MKCDAQQDGCFFLFIFRDRGREGGREAVRDMELFLFIEDGVIEDRQMAVFLEKDDEGLLYNYF